MRREAAVAFGVALAAMTGAGPSVQQVAARSAGAWSTSEDIVLRPTSHPHVPTEASQVWMVPEGGTARTTARRGFVKAVELVSDGSFDKALPILSQPFPREDPLRPYVEYYKGVAELGRGRADRARVAFQALAAAAPAGFLAEAAALREAEADEALGDPAAAVSVYQRLSNTRTTAPDDVLMRLARAARAAGDLQQAAAAYSRVYFEFPFSDLAAQASDELDRLAGRQPIAAGTNRFKLALGRAERLFGGKRYAPARQAFESVREAADGSDRELVDLRIAECDYFLKRPRNARDGLRPYLDTTSRRGEALYFYAIALRDLGDRATYLRLVRRVVDEFPTESWAEDALNNLATHYILENNDTGADETFRELFATYPSGRYAERAAWKIGWTAYRNRSYAEAARVFEEASARFPRSDYRPPWLYWSGRAHEMLMETAVAQARYRLAAADYLNSYYGRLAASRLDGRTPAVRLVADVTAGGRSPASSVAEDGVPAETPLPPNETIIRALLAAGLYREAVDELRYAQATWGESPAVAATMAWALLRQGQAATGAEQFTLYRRAITTMRRAYPQFMAEGGERLPAELRKVIFPLSYWDLIRRHAAERHLDPYLVAALVAQESTFVADIRSSSHAVGLMQLLPSTARQYARRLRMRYSAKLLTNPDANIRMGTAYLADKIREFGELHLALASYNAGERAVRRWVAERPDVPTDEFVDDIPYPETQNYVKRILGTADDYRRLYGN